MHELVTPAINFAILVGLLFYFLRKPVVQAVLARREQIKKEVEEAQVLKVEAERKLREFDQKLHAFETEAKALLDRARADGEAIKEKIIKNAQETAARIVKETESLTVAKIDEFKAQLRKEVTSQAVTQAEKLIKDRLSKEDHRRIVNEYVGKVQAQ